MALYRTELAPPALAMLAVIAALLACKGSANSSAPSPTQSATAAALGATPAPAPDTQWNPRAADIIAFAAILDGRIGPTSTDATAKKTEINSYQVPDWDLVQLTTYRSNKDARSLHLEGKAKCKPERLAERVRLTHDGGDGPLSAKWYALSGGPFDGMILKAFLGQGESCNLHIVTVKYAVEAGWKPPK